MQIISTDGQQDRMTFYCNIGEIPSKQKVHHVAVLTVATRLSGLAELLQRIVLISLKRKRKDTKRHPTNQNRDTSRPRSIHVHEPSSHHHPTMCLLHLHLPLTSTPSISSHKITCPQPNKPITQTPASQNLISFAALRSSRESAMQRSARRASLAAPPPMIRIPCMSRARIRFSRIFWNYAMGEGLSCDFLSLVFSFAFAFDFQFLL
jgi:hypothetical protein